jgi:hypothetical protein
MSTTKRIRQSLKLIEKFRNKFISCSEGLLTACQTPKLEDPRLLAVCGYLFKVVIAGGEWLALHPRERATIKHWLGGWVGPRTGLDDVERDLAFQHIASCSTDSTITTHTGCHILTLTYPWLETIIFG